MTGQRKPDLDPMVQIRSDLNALAEQVRAGLEQIRATLRQIPDDAAQIRATLRQMVR